MKRPSRRNEPLWKTEQFRHLKRLNQQGRLALFIGAGISHGCGLPGWDVLIPVRRATKRNHKPGVLRLKEQK
jgi:hypothetical protein